MAVAFLDVGRATLAVQPSLSAAQATARRVSVSDRTQPPSPRLRSHSNASLLLGLAGCATAAAVSQGRPKRVLRTRRRATSSLLREDEVVDMPAVLEPSMPSMNSLPSLRAIPFLPEPRYRQYVRDVPGDAGFDPLGLAGDTSGDFAAMLEWEIKHARVAMLAGVGFVAPELLHSRLAASLGLPNLMAENGCTPTNLNDGLVEPMLLGPTVVIFAIMGLTDVNIPRDSGYYGWDPTLMENLLLPSMDRSTLQLHMKEMAESEIKHGRVAMIAVAYMAIHEYMTKEPIWPQL